MEMITRIYYSGAGTFNLRTPRISAIGGAPFPARLAGEGVFIFALRAITNAGEGAHRSRNQEPIHSHRHT